MTVSPTTSLLRPTTSLLNAIARVASLATILALCVPAGATGYDTSWGSIDGGGGTVTLGEGQYVLQGVIGQPDAGKIQVGTMTLEGGFLFSPDPEIGVSPSTGDFGNRAVEESGSTNVPFTIANSGFGELVFDTPAFEITGTNADCFSIPTPPSTDPLGHGDSVVVTVAFDPLSEGPKSATLFIRSNDPNEPEIEVPLSGVGLPTLTLTSYVSEGDPGGTSVFKVRTSIHPNTTAFIPVKAQLSVTYNPAAVALSTGHTPGQLGSLTIGDEQDNGNGTVSRTISTAGNSANTLASCDCFTLAFRRDPDWNATYDITFGPTPGLATIRAKY